MRSVQFPLPERPAGFFMIRITELALPIGHSTADLRSAILRRLDIAEDALLDYSLFKRSYDARKKNSDILFIYVIDVTVKDEPTLLKRFHDDRNIRPAPDVRYQLVAAAPPDPRDAPAPLRPPPPPRRPAPPAPS